MPRMIDADVLLSQVKRSREKNPYTGAMLGSLNAVYDFTHRDVLNLINSAPTIDAEPVRHGWWIDMQEDDATEGMWRCSECGSDRYFDIFTPEEAGCYYCPNCGAKMDEEVQHD